MGSLYRYFAACDKRGVNKRAAYSALLKSFERGAVTYPRADGYYHPGIEIVDESALVKGVREILEEPVEAVNIADSKIEGNPYMVMGAIRVVTPAALERVYALEPRRRMERIETPLEGKSAEAGLEREYLYERSSAKATHPEIYEKWKGGIGFSSVEIGKSEVSI